MGVWAGGGGVRVGGMGVFVAVGCGVWVSGKVAVIDLDSTWRQHGASPRDTYERRATEDCT